MSTPADSAPREARALLGVAVASAVAVLVYALVRSFERLVLLEPNPAALVWSERSAIFWRLVIAVYAGGASAFGAVALGRRAPRSATRLLLVAVVIAAVVVTLQMALLP